MDLIGLDLSVKVLKFLKTKNSSEYFYLALLSLSCLYPLLGDPFFYYGNYVDCDTTRYFGLHVSLAENKFFENNYMDDRLPSLLPVYFLYKYFGMYWAHFLNYFLTFSISLFGLNLALKQFFDDNSRWLTLVIAACSPLLLGTLTLDYTASKAEMYSLYSLAFMGLAFNSTTRKKYLFYFCASFFFMSSMHSNFKYIMYLSFIPILYLTDLNPEKFRLVNFVKFVIAALFGYLVMIIFFGSINVIFLDGHFFSFKDLLFQISSDESQFRLDFLSRLEGTPLAIYFVVLFTWSLLHLRRVKRVDGYIVTVWSMFFLNLIYIIAGGNFFVPQRSSAFNTLLFFVFPAFIASPFLSKNVNLKFLPIFLVFGLYLATIKFINPQVYVWQNFGYQLGYYAVLIYVLIAIVTYTIPKYFKGGVLNAMSIILLVAAFCIIRPDNRGNGSWFQELGESDSRFEHYELQYEAAIYFRKFKFKGNPYFFFDLTDIPKGESIALSFNGCLAHLKVFHHSFKGLSSQYTNWTEGTVAELREMVSAEVGEQWMITSGDKIQYENFVRQNIIDSDIKIFEFIESYRYGSLKKEIFHIYRIKSINQLTE